MFALGVPAFASLYSYGLGQVYMTISFRRGLFGRQNKRRFRSFLSFCPAWILSFLLLIEVGMYEGKTAAAAASKIKNDHSLHM
ncbi:hypothetical protein B4119_3872 [Parageobacillus caldoxylosilyticus]|uniref:Uncharacterized protein n=2 Tax=Saccharococcus caldoxylosilyticus TaxID=81408 RepID=A0A150M493_9BACL|nr:hypothetical protein B4119_3872 [Parageobacillus caldoxylosilyticus]